MTGAAYRAAARSSPSSDPRGWLIVAAELRKNLTENQYSAEEPHPPIHCRGTTRAKGRLVPGSRIGAVRDARRRPWCATRPVRDGIGAQPNFPQPNFPQPNFLRPRGDRSLQDCRRICGQNPAV